MKSLINCLWEYEILKSADGYFWELKTFDNCGVDVTFQSKNVYTHPSNAIHAVKVFLEQNGMKYFASMNPNGKSKKFKLDDGTELIVDIEDYATVRGHEWFRTREGIVNRNGATLSQFLVKGITIHKNGDHFDFRRSNLVSPDQANRKINSNNKTGCVYRNN